MVEAKNKEVELLICTKEHHMQIIELTDNPSEEQLLGMFNKIPSINTVITRRRLAGVSRSKRRRLHKVKRKNSLKIIDEAWQLIPRAPRF